MTSEEHKDLEHLQLPILPGRIRDAALAEIALLSGFVQTVSLEDWEKPSAITSWSIGDVVAHLNLAIGLYSRVVDAALAGRGSGTAWRMVAQLTKKAQPIGSPVFNAINNAVPRVMGEAMAPETLRGQFAAACRGLRERLDRLQPGDYGRPVHYMGSPWPLSFFLAAVVNELAVHGWDMRSAIDPEARLGSDARAVLPWFYWGATSYMFHRPSGFTGTIGASLENPAAAFWWTISDGGTSHHTGEAEHPDALIQGDSGAFVLALAGRIQAASAQSGGSLSVTGDTSRATRFLGAWKIA